VRDSDSVRNCLDEGRSAGAGAIWKRLVRGAGRAIHESRRVVEVSSAPPIPSVIVTDCAEAMPTTGLKF